MLYYVLWCQPPESTSNASIITLLKDESHIDIFIETVEDKAEVLGSGEIDVPMIEKLLNRYECKMLKKDELAITYALKVRPSELRSKCQ